jgi:hypothetical protein
MPKLGNFIQKMILVSIPGLSKDDQAYPYKLVGIEPHGLWLESEIFGKDFIAQEHGEPACEPFAAFVPYAQIAYVLCDGAVRGVAHRRVLVSSLGESARDVSRGSEKDEGRGRKHKK